MPHRAPRDHLEPGRKHGRGIMSAAVIPWRQRTLGTELTQPVYFPALIDGEVTVHALMEGLAAVGLALTHDPVTGKFVIVPR
jgi:hypothetical protein